MYVSIHVFSVEWIKVLQIHGVLHLLVKIHCMSDLTDLIVIFDISISFYQLRNKH